MSIDRKTVVRAIKMIVALKVALLVGIFAAERHWLSFGEKRSEAAEKSAPPGPSDPVPANPEPGKPDTKADPTKPEDASETAAAPTKPAVKSILDEFLNLKPLDEKSAEMDKIGRYLELAEEAKRQVVNRHEKLELKEQQLSKLEKLIDEKAKALDEERKFIAKTLQKEKEIKDDRLKAVTELYEKMEPKIAAPVFADMDKDLVVALFNKLKRKQVTKILEAMDPKKSLVITEYFSRIASAREYDLLKEMNVSLQKAFNDCKEPTAEKEPEKKPEKQL